VISAPEINVLVYVCVCMYNVCVCVCVNTGMGHFIEKLFARYFITRVQKGHYFLAPRCSFSLSLSDAEDSLFLVAILLVLTPTG
jgi:hypothetical protein